MPGPRSVISTARTWGEVMPSSRNSTSPPRAYSNALRAISDTAVAMRVWSWMSKPTSAAICRARWRASTTSRS